MVLYDSHAEDLLTKEGSQLVIAGCCVTSGRTLHAYSNMSCLLEYQDAEDDETSEPNNGE